MGLHGALMTFSWHFMRFRGLPWYFHDAFIGFHGSFMGFHDSFIGLHGFP